MSLVTEAYQKLKSAGRLFNCGPDNFDCVKCKNTVPEDSRSSSFDKRDNRYNQKAPEKRCREFIQIYSKTLFP